MRPTTIHGLSEQRQLVRGGKLKIGRKKTILSKGREVEIPEKIDHFRFCPNDESLQMDYQNLYGDQPKSLPVVLPSDRREDVFPQALCCWRGGKLWCTGDNRVALRRNFEAGTSQEVACNDQCPYRYLRDLPEGETEEQRKQRTCKPEGLLRVLLPDLPTSHVFELRCGKLSIIKVNTCLDVIEMICGRIGFIPLTLSLVPQQVVVGKSAMTVYLVHLDVRTSLLELAAGRGRSAALLGTGLPMVDQVDGDLAEEEVDGEELTERVDALFGPEPAKVQAAMPVEAPAAKVPSESPKAVDDAEARDRERVLIDELLESPHMTDPERQTAREAIAKMTLKQLQGYRRSLNEIIQKRDKAGRPQETQASLLGDQGTSRNAVAAGM